MVAIVLVPGEMLVDPLVEENAPPPRVLKGAGQTLESPYFPKIVPNHPFSISLESLGFLEVQDKLVDNEEHRGVRSILPLF